MSVPAFCGMWRMLETRLTPLIGRMEQRGQALLFPDFGTVYTLTQGRGDAESHRRDVGFAPMARTGANEADGHRIGIHGFATAQPWGQPTDRDLCASAALRRDGRKMGSDPLANFLPRMDANRCLSRVAYRSGNGRSKHLVGAARSKGLRAQRDDSSARVRLRRAIPQGVAVVF